MAELKKLEYARRLPRRPRRRGLFSFILSIVSLAILLLFGLSAAIGAILAVIEKDLILAGMLVLVSFLLLATSAASAMALWADWRQK